MGRLAGSKNKPKVTTALIGEIINKPVKKDVIVFKDPNSDEELVVPAGSFKDPEAGKLTEMQPTVPKKLPKAVRDVSEKVDFIMEDLQSLRNYMCRFEDAFAAAKKEGILITIPDKPSELKTKTLIRRKKNA